MTDPIETYDFVLVLDEPRQWFEDGARALQNLRERFGRDELLSFDFFHEVGTALICLLHFHWDMFGPDLPATISTIGHQGHFRILEPMRLKPEERDRFYAASFKRLGFCREGLTDPAGALTELRRRIVGEPMVVTRDTSAETALKLSVQFATAEDFLVEYAKNTLGRGIFIPSEALPEVGQAVQLTIQTRSGQGPITLSGRVIHTRTADVAGSRGESPGFAVGFLLPPNEQSMFESFKIAVRRGEVWPEKSGRRYERFPIQLRVEYLLDTERRKEHTTNISRGGMFLDSFDPPPVGLGLSFKIFAPGSDDAVFLNGEIAHVVTAVEATERGIGCGAGIRFVDSPSDVLEQLSTVLASVNIPTNRRALVVDDDRFFRRVLGNILRLGGFAVLEAENTQRAFELLLEELLALDVMILDLYLPGESGVDLMKKIRKVGGETHLPIAILTGSDLDEAERDQLLRDGADVVLAKSLEPQEILFRVESCLERLEDVPKTEG